MNTDSNNIEKIDDEFQFQDNWLADNLKLTQLEPSKDFTKNIVEEVIIKPNPLSGSPLFWILAAIPSVILIWIILYFLSSANLGGQFNLKFISNIVNDVSIYSLTKYALMVTFAGLFFIGLDYFLSKRLLHRESFFSFLLI